MDYTVELLGTNDKDRVLAGLQCLLAICRAYRFKPNDDENKAQLQKIIEGSFPRLLDICRELVVQESDDAGEMLHIALKAFKHATFVRIYNCLVGDCTLWPALCFLGACNFADIKFLSFAARTTRHFTSAGDKYGLV